MDDTDKRELVSALADGQLAGDELARGMAVATGDAAAREAWHAYHLIGDVLRSADLARAAPPGAFLEQLQARLARERVIVAVAQPAVAPVREAANDGSFRWKVAAGVASVAAVSALAWNLVGVAPAQAPAPQLASTAPAGTVLAGTQQGVMIRDPRLDELLAAHRQVGAAALVAPAGYLRTATFDGQSR